jgi:hypothetical protein
MTYQFKITLDHSEPTIWRRVTVPASFTFDDSYSDTGRHGMAQCA